MSNSRFTKKTEDQRLRDRTQISEDRIRKTKRRIDRRQNMRNDRDHEMSMDRMGTGNLNVEKIPVNLNSDRSGTCTSGGEALFVTLTHWKTKSRTYTSAPQERNSNTLSLSL